MPHLRINAGPGCGKSTTLAGLYSYIRAKNKDYLIKQATEEQLAIYQWCDENLPDNCREKAGYAAFNDEIVQTMKPRVHDTCECKTFHGWGYKILNGEYGFVPIAKGGRTNYIISKITGKALNQLDSKEKWKWMSVGRHMEKLKEELLPNTFENFKLVHNKYDTLAPFAVFEEMKQYSDLMIVEMKKVDRKVGIDFIDQIWLSIFIAKKPIMPLGLIDEDQDLSPLRLMLARLVFENLIFCGDENQAVNAYAGADPESVKKIREIVALELPLKTSFRCPQHICNKVNAIKPTAQLRPLPERSDEGVEERVAFHELGSMLRKFNNPDPASEEDAAFYKKYKVQHGLNHWEQVLILSRYNSSLIRTALELNERDIPCYVRGQTIIDNLCDIVENRKASCMEELDTKLMTWLNHCSRNAPEMIQMQLADKVRCIKLVMEKCEYPEDVPLALKKFLKPAKSKGFIKLSTIHGAKGLEAKHVFILFPPVEHPGAKTEMEVLQEKNLHLVAVSRSSLNLFWVMDDE